MEEIKVKIPEGITVTKEKNTVTVSGPNGELSKELKHPKVKIDVEGNEIKITSPVQGRREKAVMYAYQSHFNNLFQGVTKGYTVKMQIVTTHFPVTVKVEGNEVVVENFLGERMRRRADIVGDSKVEIQGNDVTITGPNKENVGQTAGNIESSTRVVGRDRRVFKDGIYITKKVANE